MFHEQNTAEAIVFHVQGSVIQELQLSFLWFSSWITGSRGILLLCCELPYGEELKKTSRQLQAMNQRPQSTDKQ